MTAGPAAAARVLVVDDQTLFRAGLARLLNEDERVSVVGEAADGQEAIAAVEAFAPDVVLIDLRMPTLDGIQATRAIKRRRPETRILVLTTFEVDDYVLEALRAGADGYVLKDATPDAIAASIAAVRAGERVFAGPVAERMLARLAPERAGRESSDGLTARELEILKLLAQGLANKQIAYQLDISEKTVRNHVSNIYEKLHIFDRSQAVLYAVRKGLVEV